MASAIVPGDLRSVARRRQRRRSRPRTRTTLTRRLAREAGLLRRPVERRRAGRRASRSLATARPRRHRHDLSRRRRSLPVRAVLGRRRGDGAARSPARDARVDDPRARRATLSGRVLRRAARSARRRRSTEAWPPRQHHRPRARAGAFSSGPTTTARPRARADARGRQLLGFYHSHPDHPAVPSAFDLEHAWPNLSYVDRLRRDGGVPREMRSWRLRADRSGFDEEPIT